MEVTSINLAKLCGVVVGQLVVGTLFYGLILMLVAKLIRVKEGTFKKAIQASFLCILLGTVLMLATVRLSTMGGIVVRFVISSIAYYFIMRWIFSMSWAKTTVFWLITVVFLNIVYLVPVIKEAQGGRNKARYTVSMVNINAIETALHLYRMDVGDFPTTEQGLQALMQKPAFVSDNWRGPYLDKKLLDGWGREYKYVYPGQRNSDYDLYSLGRDGVESEDDISFR